MQPSKYQAAILDWVMNGEGHGACNAVAGAGKSTTLRLVAEALKAATVSPSLVRVMVFGKSNAEDLKKKFDKTWGDSIATLHSTGWGLLKTHFRIRARQGKVTDAKPRYIGQDLGFLPNYRKRSAGSLIEAKAIKKGKDGEVLKLYNLLRLTNQATEAIANPTAAVEAVNRIIGHFDIQGIEDVEAVTEAVRSMLVEGVRRADQKLEFDFTDQIWLPVHLGLTPSQPYQFLLVDECQDLNAAQLELCFQLAADGGRMLFVGDPCQPPDTKVLRVTKRARGRHTHLETEWIAIKDLQIGDRVYSYSTRDGHFYSSATIIGITERPFAGQLVVVKSASGKVSKYTPNHHCIASFEHFRNHYCVYLMQKGSQFRVGMSRVEVGNGQGSGPVVRLRQERGDAAWVLGFYETKNEAFIMEQAISGKFGLPQLVFSDAPIVTPELVRRAWDFVGSNAGRAYECLKYFGKDIRYPLFKAGELWQQSLKRPMVVQAVNLIDGCLMLPYNGKPNAYKADWEAVTVSSEVYCGSVFSLDVEKYHTYIADGIVTHNCQSILGFAGADHRSFQTIVDRTQATELPLSICYRCPRDHIRLVKASFPEIPIEAAENADAGEICETFEAGLNGLLKDGDLVLGRKTAPLVSTCIQLIAGGVKAAVKGRDIGEQLKEEISTIAKVEGFQFDNFSDHLRTYRSEQVAYYRKRGGDVAEQLVEAVTDRCEAIEAIYTAQQSAQSTADLENYIDSLFSDAHQPVTLCTIHRAKGLEADRVFIIRPGDLPLTWKGQLSWQLEQEQNLLYVALTRSKQQLTIVKKNRNDDVPWFVDLDDEDDEATVNADSQPILDNALTEAIAPAAPPEVEAEPEATVEADSGNTGGNVFNQVMQHLQELDDQVAAVDQDEDLEDDPGDGPEPEGEGPQAGRQWVSLGMIAMPVNPDNPYTYETQSRVAMDGSIVERYAEDMAQGRWEWERDPVILFAEQVPNGPVIYWVGDGHHRIAAANFAHLDMVFADVRIGTKRDAIFHSLTANRQHGLQRTNDDKRNAVRIALLDPEWTKMSDRAIAEHCGVSAPFVGKIRSELEESGQVEATTQRVSKSGKTLQTANIGTKPAPSNGSHAATDDAWDDEDDEPEDQGDGRRKDGSIDRRRASARNGSGERSNIVPLPTKGKENADGGKAKPMPKETPDEVVRLANRYGNRKLIEWLSWEMPMDELIKLAAAIDGVLEGRVDSVAAGHSTEEW